MAWAEAGYLQIIPEYESTGEEHNLYSGYLISRFNIPIQDRLSLFIKLGVTYLSSPAEEDGGFAPFAGAGIGYALTDKVDLRVQFHGPNALIFGASLLGGGIAYHF